MNLLWRQELWKLRASLVCLAFGLSALVLLVAPACVPEREDIAVFHESSQAAASVAAHLRAKELGGIVNVTTDTGSMEPILHGDDYIVSVPTPYEQLEVGMIVTYRPDWNNGRLTCHRLVGRWHIGGGWVVEGDGPKNRAETNERMTKEKYVSHVIAVYRFP